MSNRIRPLILALGACLSLPAAADQFGDFTFTSDGTAITITGYTGAGGAIAIPATINSLPVKTIGASAFSNKSAVTSVTVPASVVTLGDNAFSGCTGLTGMTIQGGVTMVGRLTTIGTGTFQGCSALASMEVPLGVTSIGGGAFFGCSALQGVTIPSSVTSVGAGAFVKCASLTSISVSAANTVYASIDGVLFNKAITTLIQYPGGKAGAYAVPVGVTTIDSNAFGRCAGLTVASIPASVSVIGSMAFYPCSGLGALTVDPANPAFASVNGVLYDKSLTTLIQYPGGRTGAYVIPAGVTHIGDSAVRSVAGLTGVTIPASVTTIGISAFTACTGLAHVNIPASVTEIGNRAFSACASLTSAVFTGSAPTVGFGVFDVTAQGPKVYFGSGATGFTTPIWQGYPSVALLPQELWRQGYFGASINTASAADFADPDQDGVVNLQEYAFGLHPLQSDADGTPRFQRVGNSLTCNVSHVTGVTYGAEWSANLSFNSWQPLPDTGDYPQHVFTLPIDADQRNFVRLTVKAEPVFVN